MKRWHSIFIFTFVVIELLFLLAVPNFTPDQLPSGIIGGFILALIISGMINSLFPRAEQDKPIIKQPEVFRKSTTPEEPLKDYYKEIEIREAEQKKFIEINKNLSAEEILLRRDLNDYQKRDLLSKIHKYEWSDTEELIKISERAQKKARLEAISRKVAQKAQEMYGNIPSDDFRRPIPDDVKMFVWQRDAGKCTKCGSNENLEFDHIIPVSKGGSNTERNIQLLCEKCNRSKSDNIS